MHTPVLLPVPKHLKMQGGVYRHDGLSPDALARKAKRLLDETIRKEGYRLAIREGGVEIAHSTPAGLFYAEATLKQLAMQYGVTLPCLEIDDAPDIEVRGAMIDISRDKIPSMQTLRGMIDLLAGFKINHLQFYIEGFSYAYSFLGDKLAGETPVTAAEFRELDAYARSRHIELVPNQNCFGHMAAWLALDEYRDLAECPDGFPSFGMHNPPATLNPLDPGSIALAGQMMGDLLPNFTSPYFNADLDEPFELGKGRSKAADAEGADSLYLNYVMKIHELAKRHGRRLMMAGDTVAARPDLLAKLPRDIAVLDWGYEWFTPFEERSRVLQESGLEFYLLPGTGTSLSISGKTENMLENVRRAAEAAKEHGARGVIVTDWGDGGHWQYAPASYAGFAWSAALCWNVGSQGKFDLAKALDTLVFRDPSGRMGRLWMDIGNSYRFEDIRIANMTTTALGLKLGILPKPALYQILDGISRGVNEVGKKMLAMNKLDDAYLPESRKTYRYAELTEHLDRLEAQAGAVGMRCGDAGLVLGEFRQTIRFLRLGAEVRHLIDRQGEDDGVAALERLKRIAALADQVITEHRRLWLTRNRAGGLERSLADLYRLRDQAAAMAQED